MKKAGMLLMLGALAFAACQKEEVPSKDAELAGSQVELPALDGIRKVFVLNEGGMGSNNATLDFIRWKDGLYVGNAFAKMNPGVTGGLGDVGNDIAVNGDEVWMAVNNSGIVEVISAADETEIAAITVPTPRNIAFDKQYAYVTSWAGAFVAGSYDESYNYVITDSKNPKGVVYRINLSTKKVEGSVEVGYQPEGIACCNGRLYVANSGGIASQLPPDYAYDRTVSIIDTKTFKLEKNVDVQVNLKNVYADSQGNIYVTTLGNYFSVHSGLYMLPAGNPESPKLIGDYVSISAIGGDTVYCIGTDSEFDWNAAHTYKGWKVSGGTKEDWTLSVAAATPYSLAALGGDVFLVGDAGDYFNPGSVSCYSKGSKLWSQTAGVCPGHYAVW